MQELSEYTKRHWDVVVIGGGATGAGTLRDLAMRGVKALLLEQRDLVHGTSSRVHGLLHSGAPDLLQSFQQERWYGIRPVLWGSELRETELARGMYGATLNVDGADE